MRRNSSCVLAALALAAMLGGCGKRDEKPPVLPPAPLPVTNAVQPVKPEAPEVALLPATVAELQGSVETPVIAKNAGYLVRQVYKENAFVTAGDVLFLLDPRAFHPG